MNIRNSYHIAVSLAPLAPAGANDCQPPCRQPEHLVYDGKEYVLCVPWHRTSRTAPIASGPFYAAVGEEPENVWKPDATFTDVKEPSWQCVSTMHPVQFFK